MNRVQFLIANSHFAALNLLFLKKYLKKVHISPSNQYLNLEDVEFLFPNVRVGNEQTKKLQTHNLTKEEDYSWSKITKHS